MARVLLFCFMLAFAVLGHSATEPTEATVVGVNERGYMLRVGKEIVPVEETSKTKFWVKRAAATHADFKVDDAVWVRLKTTETPTVVREIADRASWAWLTAIRKEVKAGTIKSRDDRYLTVAFPDGTEMAYRATPKSKVRLGSKTASVQDLKEGQRVWVKGRTLATLDVWLVSAEDAPPPKVEVVASRSNTKSSESARSRRQTIGSSGTVVGDVEMHAAAWRMIDFPIDGKLFHFSYTNETVFMRGRIRVAPGTVEKGTRVRVAYRRDAFGRIIARKVELL